LKGEDYTWAETKFCQADMTKKPNTSIYNWKSKLPFQIDHPNLKIIVIQHHPIQYSYIYFPGQAFLLDDFEFLLYLGNQISSRIAWLLSSISAVFTTNNFTTDAYCLCLGEILAQFLVDI